MSVTVGQGGICRVNGNGISGSNSVFDTLVAVGGGAGMDMGTAPTGNNNGGSGGGAGREHGGADSGKFGTGIPGQGNNGGPKAGLGNAGAAGGGGAGTPGTSGSKSGLGRAGDGGSGSYFSQYAGIGFGSPAGWFAGGGGGSHGYETNPGFGGIGGGGTGGGSVVFGNPGIKNTGGGGGGGAVNGSKGGYGGSGIVIISYDTLGPGTAFTSSIDLNINESVLAGTLQSTTYSSLTVPNKIGLVSIARTGSNTVSIHRNITSSVFSAPITASKIDKVYSNALFEQNALVNYSPYSVSYLSYGSGLTANEMSLYHSAINKLQYDLGRANLIEAYPAAAAYSVRRLSTYADYAMTVRRDWDNASSSFGFNSNGDLDTGSLLAFVTGSAGTGSGFVQTWYDQSGNNRHAIQTTNAFQPLILSSDKTFEISNI